jgi:hypothetical protein
LNFEESTTGPTRSAAISRPNDEIDESEGEIAKKTKAKTRPKIYETLVQEALGFVSAAGLILASHKKAGIRNPYWEDRDRDESKHNPLRAAGSVRPKPT